MVDLACQRFDLCYAGLFLVDSEGQWTGEPNRWAVLRSGTGEAGRKMLAQDHKLEIGGTSMIGWCTANRQARIALDVGEEAVRFDNPLLPETRSEMALPLISGGRVIGALSIQSSQPAAFSEEDIATLQSMADQLANAIQNAYLFDQIQRAQQALAQQAKELENELTQFAQVAAHDLQEPLRLIASYSQLLQRRYKGQLGDDADEFIDQAVYGATRIKALINDLLTYSKVYTQGKPFEQVNCDQILNQVLVRLQTVIKATQTTITHTNLPTLVADAAQLETVFYHLINNAIKFHDDQPPHIHIQAQQKREEQEWQFSFEDNGIGIEEPYFDNIFKLFQRLHPGDQYPGTGVGLALCKKIVERHGGKIWVESQPGEGSTFYFTLPALL